MILAKNIVDLMTTAYLLGREDFPLIFGKKNGDHLYWKFCLDRNNIVDFMNQLDANNQERLYNWMLSKCADPLPFYGS